METKEKPIWKKEWVWRAFGFLAVVIGNELQSKGDWKAVNWSMVAGAALLFLAREFTKTDQDTTKINSRKNYEMGYEDGKRVEKEDADLAAKTDPVSG